MQLAYVFLGYFLGSMLFGYRITWLLKGVDIRKLAEDENPGTYNAFVFGGFWCGILTLLADMGKGYLPVIFFAAFKSFMIFAPLLFQLLPAGCRGSGAGLLYGATLLEYPAGVKG